MPVMVQLMTGAGSLSSLEVLLRLGRGECSRRGERSSVLRGEGGGVLAMELHMIAGMLAARGRSWIAGERERGREWEMKGDIGTG